jgi:double-strand break repair protein MRE11
MTRTGEQQQRVRSEHAALARMMEEEEGEEEEEDVVLVDADEADLEAGMARPLDLQALEQPGASGTSQSHGSWEGNADTFKILLATDNHLGYLEKDPVRGADSFRAFEEILQLAVAEKVGAVLLLALSCTGQS